jgi:hypothetical protein
MSLDRQDFECVKDLPDVTIDKICVFLIADQCQPVKTHGKKLLAGHGT